MRMSSVRDKGEKDENSDPTVRKNLSNSKRFKEGQLLRKKGISDGEMNIKGQYDSRMDNSKDHSRDYSRNYSRDEVTYEDESSIETSTLSVSSISYNPYVSCNSSPILSPDELPVRPIESDAENLLIFKNKVKKTVEKNFSPSLGMGGNENKVNEGKECCDKVNKEDRNERRDKVNRIESWDRSDRKESWEGREIPLDEIHYNNREDGSLNRKGSYVGRDAIRIKPGSDTSIFDSTNVYNKITIKKNSIKDHIDIQPISSFTNTHQSFKRISWNSSSDDSKQVECDPLTVLRNVAKIEANNFRDRAEEAYFSPPVSPKKHPLQYLKKAVSREEKNEMAEAKIKSKKIQKQTSLELDSDLEETDQKSINDFDESIFNYNQDTKLFYCPWEGCGKSFPSLSRIKRHYIIHTKIKPFKCLNKGCIRRFSRKDNMLQHYRVHCPFANSKNS